MVDGVADPQMHVRIASDGNYLRIDPVRSREQYRWMERFIPMVDEPELRGKLTQAIDGKGAFRRFKDVLMAYARGARAVVHVPQRAAAHVHGGVAHRARHQGDRRGPVGHERGARDERARQRAAPPSTTDVESTGPKSTGRRTRNAEASRQQLRELAEALGPRELESLVSFAEFLKARRSARGFAHHHEHQLQERAEATRASGTQAEEKAP